VVTRKFRYGGYMGSTGGGTMAGASSSYSNSNSGSSNSPGHPGNSNYSSNNNNYNSYLEASGTGNQNVPPPVTSNISGVGTNVSNITGNIIDPKVQQESNEGYYLNNVVSNPSNNAGGIFDDFTYQDIQDYNEHTAYNQSLQNQQEMQQSIETAYGLTSLKPEQEEERNKSILAAIAAGQNITSQSGIDQGTSQIQNLTNQQIQQLIDSGFVAAESDGILGGTMGAELVTNRLKEQLDNATNQEDYQAALDGLNALNAGIGGKDATNMQYSMGLLNPDQSAVYSFGDVESDPYLYKAYQDMASKNITPNKYRSYMHNIGAFGHRPTNFNTGYGGGGGYGGGYGGGGGGDGYGGPPPEGRAPQGQPNEAWGQQNALQQAMININAPKGFRQGYARGGIVSLVC